jgi:hypothetical protein
MILNISLGISHLTKSSEESIPIKRKRSNGVLSKSISHDKLTKRSKPDIFSQRDSLTVIIQDE